MLSVKFGNRESTALSELAKRKDEYETFKAIRLQKIISEQQLRVERYTTDAPQNVDGYFHIDREEYHLDTFEELMFGNDDEDDEEATVVTGVKFYFCMFTMCCFTNIQFVNCCFIGCTFSECFTMNDGVTFADCSFSRNDPTKQSVDDMFSYFRLCELTVKFIDCEMQQNIFSKTNFYFSEFQRSDMSDIIMAECGFDIAFFSDCILNDARIVTSKFIKFLFRDTYVGTKVNRNTFFGEVHNDYTDIRELRYAIDMYFSLSELFQENKISDLYGEYFFLYKKAEMRTLAGRQKLQSVISFIVCGYGERPFYCLINALILIVTCGNLYFLLGLKSSDALVQFNMALPIGKLLKDLFECYHFSLVTFTTVGYGNLYPHGFSFVVNGFEMVFAVLLVGIWVSTLVRKMVR